MAGLAHWVATRSSTAPSGQNSMPFGRHQKRESPPIGGLSDCDLISQAIKTCGPEGKGGTSSRISLMSPLSLADLHHCSIHLPPNLGPNAV